MSPSKLKYPYAWGRDRVNVFVEKYARGAYLLARLLDIPPGELRHYMTVLLCRGNSLKWEVMKRVIKYICMYDDVDFKHLTAEERKRLYKCLRTNAEDDEIDALDGREAIDSLIQIPLFLKRTR